MPFLLIVQLIVLSSCAVLKLISELFWHDGQRFVMPLVLAIGICIVLHSLWLGFLVLPMIAPLCMGYKDYGSSDGFARAVWLLLICVAAGLGLALTGHLSCWLYVPYCILGAVWGGVTRAWLNLIIAPFSGALIGSIIFLVH
jgi:hypothetical protein